MNRCAIDACDVCDDRVRSVYLSYDANLSVGVGCRTLYRPLRLTTSTDPTHEVEVDQGVSHLRIFRTGSEVVSVQAAI
jgi:hypothetical protein